MYTMGIPQLKTWKTKFYLKLNTDMICMVLKDLNPLFHTVKIQCMLKVITYDFDNSKCVTKIT